MAPPVLLTIPIPDDAGDFSAWIPSALVELASEAMGGATPEDRISVFVSDTNAIVLPDPTLQTWGIVGGDVTVLSMPGSGRFWRSGL